MPLINFEKYNVLMDKSYTSQLGKVAKVVGLTIESIGPSAKLNDLCLIRSNNRTEPVKAEVVGFRDDRVLLMPYDDVEGVGLGSWVENTGAPLQVAVGEELLGCTLNGVGEPMTELELSENCPRYSVEATPPDPLTREMIADVLPLGVKAVDGLITVGKGQRIGIFAGSGVGKSTLMGMFARNTKADINVIALIGERGREVREFIERDLGEEGMKRSVVVVATSDKPALIRNKAAKTATAVAEYFRDQHKSVLLMMDSVTRFGRAQREIGLAAGEPPTRRGFPPSVFSTLPKLMERAGNSDKGSITALYTVLVEGDDMAEPIADETRSILDGHIILSRKLAAANHYPAIDVQASVSRVMNAIVTKEHKKAAQALRKVLAKFAEVELLVQIGEYKKGSDKEADDALARINAVNAFLRQGLDEKSTFEETLQALYKVVA